MTTILLDDLAQRIRQQEVQLEALRRELETRQRKLATLAERKAGLLAKIQQVDAEIAAITSGKKGGKASQHKAAAALPARAVGLGRPSGNGAAITAKRGPASAQVGNGKAKSVPSADQPKLSDFIVTMLREVGRPLTVRQLALEAKGRGFVSTSNNFPKLVETRTYDLKRKGILKRAADQPGFVLAQSQNGKAKKAAGAASKPGRKAMSRKQLPLRDVLTQILQKSTKPMTGGELAAAALKAGYQTTSKRLVDSVWVVLGHMNNVENVSGQGYRLKKSKA